MPLPSKIVSSITAVSFGLTGASRFRCKRRCPPAWPPAIFSGDLILCSQVLPMYLIANFNNFYRHMY